MAHTYPIDVVDEDTNGTCTQCGAYYVTFPNWYSGAKLENYLDQEMHRLNAVDRQEHHDAIAALQTTVADLQTQIDDLEVRTIAMEQGGPP